MRSTLEMQLMKPPTREQRITATEKYRPETVSRKITGEGGGRELKPVLHARNLALNSYVAPEYKHMFCPHRFLYPINATQS